MPIDWNAVQSTPGVVPDVRTIRGTVPDPVSVPTISGGTSSGSQVLGLPEVPALPSEPTDTSLPYVSDYSMWESLKAGVQDTAAAALWYSYETPDFDFDDTFDVNLAVKTLQESTGKNLNDNDKSKLMRTGSQAEFDYQNQRITDEQLNNEVGAQNIGSYIAGGLVDFDLALGPLGKISKVGKVSRIAQRSIRAATVAGTSAAAYSADVYTPLSPTEIALSISAMTAGSLLLPTAKPLIKTPPPVTEAQKVE